MKFSLVICGLLVLLGLAASSPIVKRETNEIDPIKEIVVLEEADPSDDDHSDREKRKIGVVKLGVSNGLIGFVFGKLDSFIDAKTRALAVLDESNKAKNAIYGIDNTSSATSAFISDIVGKKVQAASAGIGPLINSATTFVSSKAQGLVGALSKGIAPLSSLSGSLSGGSGGSGGAGSSDGGGSGNILNIITSLSGSSGSLSGGLSNGGGESSPSSGASAGAGAGINLGAFANLGGGISTTTEDDIPEFDRNKVSLDVPSQAFGTGFTLITNISKMVGKLILNSAHRTEQVFEVFKPLFRGAFAIKGLPSDKA